MALKFAIGKTIEQNLSTYKALENDLNDTGITIPRVVNCEALLYVLQSGWERIRLVRAASKVQEKKAAELAEIIQTEAYRISPDETKDNATAVYPQMIIGYGSHGYANIQDAVGGRATTSRDNRTVVPDRTAITFAVSPNVTNVVDVIIT